MTFSNNIFSMTNLEINKINKKHLIVLLITVLLIIFLLIIKKDYYYENNLVINDEKIILLVDNDMVNKIKDKKKVLVNKIESNYSINTIIDHGDISYLDINLYPNIENISTDKYKILLGKETIFEYIIRIIKKIS